MIEPKFNRNQMVKYTVNDEVRYSLILEPVWNQQAGCYLYRLNEMMALPVYREEWLEAVTYEDFEKLAKAQEEDKLVRHPRGYITILE